MSEKPPPLSEAKAGEYVTLNNTAATPGNIKTFLLSEESTLAVANHLDAVIPTGVFHTAVGMEILIMAVFFLLVFFAVLRRTYKKRLTA